MQIIVGLGNPGAKYTLNRHNVGFIFADYFLETLVTEHNLPETHWKADKYTQSELAKTDKYIIVKPQTYMNRSGESVSKLVKNYELKVKSSTSLFIAHDDLDMTIGNFKIQKGVGPKMHNGLASIEQHVHTQDFWRIRIGVDNRQGDRTLSGEEYVLQNFSNEELNLLQDTFPQIKSRFDIVLKEI